MVVAAGLTTIDAFADAETELPGEMVTLVAPDVVQLRVVLPPTVIAAGLAANEMTVGAEAVAGTLTGEVQPVQPRPKTRMKVTGQKCSDSGRRRSCVERVPIMLRLLPYLRLTVNKRTGRAGSG